jgi:hypothetical protein
VFDWINLAEDKDEWCAGVNSVMSQCVLGGGRVNFSAKPFVLSPFAVQAV